MTASAVKGSVVLTGANGGLGTAIVTEILSRPDLSGGYHGIYTVRDGSPTPKLRRALRQEKAHAQHLHPRHPHNIVSIDLARQASVRDFAAAINGRVARGEIPPIRALVLNAGYLEHEGQTWTDEGLDKSFAVNYLGQWLLTLLLLQSMDRENGRVLVMASHIHDPYDPFNRWAGGYFSDNKWKTVFGDSTEPIAKGTRSSSKEDPSWRGGLRRYGASKLCLAMMIGELQRRLDADPSLHNISIFGLDPGWMATGIARQHPIYWIIWLIMPWIAALLSWLQPRGMFRTPSRSAKDVVAAMFDANPVLGERPKGLYLKGSVRAEMSDEAKDQKKRRMVWRDSVQYAHLKDGETMLSDWK